MSKQKIDFHEVTRVLNKVDVPREFTIELPRWLHSAAPVYQAEAEYLDWMSKVNSKFVLGTLIGAGSTKNVAAGIPSGLASAGKTLVNYDYTRSRDRIAKSRDTGTVYVSNPVYGLVRLVQSTPNEIGNEIMNRISSELNDLKGAVIFGKPVISGSIMNMRSTEERADEAEEESSK